MAVAGHRAAVAVDAVVDAVVVAVRVAAAGVAVAAEPAGDRAVRESELGSHDFFC